MLPEGLGQLNIPMTPSGIEPATFRLLAQCLNQVPPRAPFQIVMLFCKSARALDRKVCICTYWKQFLHGRW